MYILASSMISHQPTFQKKGFVADLKPLEKTSAIQHPDYKELISPGTRRRMSDVLKMAIGCALDCLQQAVIEQPDAIIVGTSMGCNHFTKKFLDKIISSGNGLLSPTPFILSPHNTIAGQISLLLGNHNYNMTHTHNTLSFELALIDGMMCIDNGAKHVLVGASDEMEDKLYNMNERLSTSEMYVTCGASFFILSPDKPTKPSIKLIDVESQGLIDNVPDSIERFLTKNGKAQENIDLILYSCSQTKSLESIKNIFGDNRLLDFKKYAGTYFTHTAFAMEMGIDILEQGRHPMLDTKISNLLIINNLIPENLGLILLEKEL